MNVSATGRLLAFFSRPRGRRRGGEPDEGSPRARRYRNRPHPNPSRATAGEGLFPWAFNSAAAFAGLDVEVAAGQRLAPVGDQVARSLEVGRPFLRDHGARRLPDRVDQAVRLYLADVDRLSDVMIGHHRRVAAGEV